MLHGNSIGSVDGEVNRDFPSLCFLLISPLLKICFTRSQRTDSASLLSWLNVLSHSRKSQIFLMSRAPGEVIDLLDVQGVGGETMNNAKFSQWVSGLYVTLPSSVRVVNQASLDIPVVSESIPWSVFNIRKAQLLIFQNKVKEVQLAFENLNK